jgi:hypothetical protein
VVLVSAGLLLAACSTSQSNSSTSTTQENPALGDALPPGVALNVQNSRGQGKGQFSLRGINLLNQEILQHIYGDLTRISVMAELRFFAK